MLEKSWVSYCNVSNYYGDALWDLEINEIFQTLGSYELFIRPDLP